MTKGKLGLPLEYKQLPEYFDAFNIGEDTAAKNDVIEQLLRQYQVKTVLDMTCGTGSQVFMLAERGYKVTGSDFSPALLDQARKKAKQLNHNVRLLHGDMRTLKLGRFDAVITIFNAIGHLTKAGFEKALRNIHKNLKPGGIYVFDIFNLDALDAAAVEGLAMEVNKTIGDVRIHLVQTSSLDREKGRLTSVDNRTLYPKVGKPQITRSQFTLQIYSATELRDMLRRSGFETLGQYGMDGAEFAPSHTLNMVTVARKY